MPITEEQVTWFSDSFGKLVANVEQALVGKTHAVRLAVTCLLSDGHLLLEDVPGTGKTLLAKSLANTIQGTQSRIQFTPDLLPSDVTGVSIPDPQTMEFEFHKGPIFASVVLADEINRASPKTQSALLEVMEENRVTVDGISHLVPDPFMVIATQNPIEQSGTYPLPEAQLDRFLMKTSIGHPDHDTTVQLLSDASNRNRSSAVEPLINSEQAMGMRKMAVGVHVDPAILSYVARIAEETRSAKDVRLGVSTRGSLSLVRCAKTWAAANGRGHVIPDDVKVLTEPILNHRIIMTPEAEFNGVRTQDVLARILRDVPPPVDRGAQ